MTNIEYRRLMEKSEQEAQNALFYEYFNYVYAIAFNKLRNCAVKEDIEECVSDIFADIFIYLDTQTAHNGDIKGIIGTIASRRAINMFRSLSAKSGRTISAEEADTLTIADNTDIVKDSENAELRRILLSIVDELGEPDSTIILQKFYGGLKSNEIAKKLSISPSAVRLRCTRAVRKLKEKLTELGLSLKEAGL